MCTCGEVGLPGLGSRLVFTWRAMFQRAAQWKSVRNHAFELPGNVGAGVMVADHTAPPQYGWPGSGCFTTLPGAQQAPSALIGDAPVLLEALGTLLLLLRVINRV
jgi:hypothetical protein